MILEIFTSVLPVVTTARANLPEATVSQEQFFQKLNAEMRCGVTKMLDVASLLKGAIIRNFATLNSAFMLAPPKFHGLVSCPNGVESPSSLISTLDA